MLQAAESDLLWEVAAYGAGRPQSRFVAGFIGRGRILPVQTGPGALARCAGLCFRMDSAQPPRPFAGATGQALVRPAAVRLTEGGANTRVVRHRYRGQDHELELALFGAPESRLLCDHVQRLAPGSEVRVEVTHGWLVGSPAAK